MTLLANFHCLATQYFNYTSGDIEIHINLIHNNVVSTKCRLSGYRLHGMSAHWKSAPWNRLGDSRLSESRLSGMTTFGGVSSESDLPSTSSLSNSLVRKSLNSSSDVLPSISFREDSVHLL